MAVQILLIRHGENQGENRRKYYGVTDVPLTPRGAALLQPADFFPAQVFCSPLCRAVQTAKILFPKAECISIPEFKEIDFGIFEGRGWWEMEEDAEYQEWIATQCTARCPGGESFAELSERTCTAFDSLMREAFEKKREMLVIVAHGGTQMAILNRWGQLDDSFFSGQTSYGEGWLLRASQWPGTLQMIEKRRFSA